MQIKRIFIIIEVKTVKYMLHYIYIAKYILIYILMLIS